MVRRTERPLVGQRAAFDLAGDGGDHRHFQQFGRQQRRQDRGQPRRQHRLAGAGRADHQQVMSAGGGDFERALGALLALDVGEVERCAVDLADLRLRAVEHLRALEMIGELNERLRRDDLDLRRGPGRFRPAHGRADQALPARIGADGGRQHAGDRGDAAVEAEFAEHGEARDGVLRDGADGRHQPERDRQIVMAAFLGQVGGREIDGDAARRQRQPGSDQRRAHAFLGFGDGFVGQADNVEGGQAGRHLHLHVDGAGLDAFEGNRTDTLDHGDAPNPLPISVA